MKADVYSCVLCHQITFKEGASTATITCSFCESVATWRATVALPEEQQKEARP